MKSLFIAAIAFAASPISPVAAQGGATEAAPRSVMIIGPYQSFERMGDVVQQINTTCRPDELGDIQSIFSQLGHGADYNIYVFCRSGTGRLGPVAYYYSPYPIGKFDPQVLATGAMANQGIHLIGIYAGITANSIHYLTARLK